jgi:hypothetical protein
MREKHAFKGSGIRKLWLTNDGDIAKFRVLTDGNDIFTHLFHELKLESSRGREFTKDVLCTRRLDAEAEFLDPESACRHCSAGVPAKPKGVLQVYVEAVAHRKPDAEGKWTPFKRGEQTLYAEQVSEVRIWLVRNKMFDMVVDKFSELGTLLDRNWELTRYGVTGQGPIQYVLEGKTPAPPSAECAKAIAELTPLDEVVAEEFGGEPKKVENAPIEEAGFGATDTTPPDDEVGFG